MKLRFHGNSLRLRLNRTEIARLAETGSVEHTVTFATGQTLSYGLESGPQAAATFQDGRIRIVIPAEDARRWIETDQTGIENSVGGLKFLVEKDFECIHKATPADADAFPNPMMDKF